MAATYAKQKSNIVSQLAAISSSILANVAAAQVLRQEAIDAGFATGGANAIIQADLDAANFLSLVPADLTAAFAAIASLDTQLAAATRTGYKALTVMKEA